MGSEASEHKRANRGSKRTNTKQRTTEVTMGSEVSEHKGSLGEQERKHKIANKQRSRNMHKPASASAKDAQ